MNEGREGGSTHMQSDRRAEVRLPFAPEFALRGRLAGAWRKLRHGTFSRNVYVMLAGAVLGQGTSLILAPVLTRVFSPAEFGYLSSYSAAVSMLCVVASLGLEIAIPISVDLAETANLTALCFMVLAGTTAVICLVSLGLSPRLMDMLLLGPVGAHRALIPIGFVCFGAYYIMVATATRQGAFREIARTRIAQGVVGPISQIALGLAGFGAPGLAIGFVLGQSAGVSLLLRRTVLASREAMATISWRGIGRAWRRYLGFPLWVSWTRLIEVVSIMMIYLLLTALYAPAVAGFLFLCDRVIARPLVIVSSSFLQVFTGEAGRSVHGDPRGLQRRFYQVIAGQALVSASVIAAANIAADWLFPHFFGARWDAAVPFLRAMSPAYMFMTVTHPVSTTLQMLERQALNAAWQVLRMAAVFAVVFTTWKTGMSAVGTVWCYSAVQAVFAVVLLGLIGWSVARLQTRPEASAAA